MAIEAGKMYDNVYSYGDLLHNPQMMQELSNNGIHKVEGLSELPKGSVVIIRAHGAPPSIYDIAEVKGLQVVDASCPFVKHAHQKIVSLEEEGYLPVVVGEETHPEVAAMREYVKKSVVVGSAADVKKVGTKHSKIGVVSQTTQSHSNFREVVTGLVDYARELKICNTICSATSKRQNAATELAKSVDVMIVVGGYNSSNTRRLAELCQRVVETHHIQEASELRAEWISGKKRVGVTAGASTPEDVTHKVVEKIRQ